MILVMTENLAWF